MMSATVMRGLSEVYGSCITSWMSRRARRTSSDDSCERSRPCTTIRPAVGFSSPTSSRANVDLPQPDSPTPPRVSPRCRRMFTRSTALTSPTRRRNRMPLESGKYLTRSSVSIMISAPGSLISPYHRPVVAGAGVPVGHVVTRRDRRFPALVLGVPAPGMERAPRWDGGQGRGQALDDRQLLALVVQPRHRLQQRLGVRVGGPGVDVVHRCLL